MLLTQRRDEQWGLFRPLVFRRRILCEARLRCQLSLSDFQIAAITCRIWAVGGGMSSADAKNRRAEAGSQERAWPHLSL